MNQTFFSPGGLKQPEVFWMHCWDKLKPWPWLYPMRYPKSREKFNVNMTNISRLWCFLYLGLFRNQSNVSFWLWLISTTGENLHSGPFFSRRLIGNASTEHYQPQLYKSVTIVASDIMTPSVLKTLSGANEVIKSLDGLFTAVLHTVAMSPLTRMAQFQETTIVSL